MYSQKPIPKPFQKKSEKTKSEQPVPFSVPIETKEKITEMPKQNRISPVAALLFLDIFAAQKKDG